MILMDQTGRNAWGASLRWNPHPQARVRRTPAFALANLLWWERRGTENPVAATEVSSRRVGSFSIRSRPDHVY